MKKSELKEIIKSAMLEGDDFINPGNTEDDQSKKDDYDYDSRPSHMKEATEVDVEDNEEVDVDIEKDVEVDDKSFKTDTEGEIQSLLMKAQEEAAKLGDEKLTDQIGNTITYFTRAHVAKIDEEAEVEMKLDESINRFKKLAGILK